MKFDTSETALVVIDPQNDALSETGAAWELVGASVRENNTVENLARLFAAAKSRGYGVFISPHYMYPHDQRWQFTGALEKKSLEGKVFFRPDPLNIAGFPGSGPTGSTATSRSSKTAKRSWLARTRYGDHRRTTLFSNSASAACAGSS